MSRDRKVLESLRQAFELSEGEERFGLQDETRNKAKAERMEYLDSIKEQLMFRILRESYPQEYARTMMANRSSIMDSLRKKFMTEESKTETKSKEEVEKQEEADVENLRREIDILEREKQILTDELARLKG